MVQLTKSLENEIKNNLISKGMDEKMIDVRSIFDESLTKEENLHLICGESDKPKNDLKPEAEDFEKKMREKEELHTTKVLEKAIKKIKDETSVKLDKYFVYTKELINTLLKSKDINALILQSETGLGKSFVTVQTLLENNLVLNKDFVVIGGHLTPLELYHLLYKYNDKIIIIDDIGSIFEDTHSKSILLSALFNPSGERWISYLTSSTKLTAPSQFIFSGKLIFCLNDLPEDLSALKSRCFFYELKFTFQEKLKICYEIAKLKKIPLEIMDWIKDNIDESFPLDFRLPIKIYEIFHSNQDWKTLSQAIIDVETDDRLVLLKELVKGKKSINQQLALWVAQTGMSRRSFFRWRKRLFPNKKCQS